MICVNLVIILMSFCFYLLSYKQGVGANRRRMNVESEIKRPLWQQCQLVGLEKTSNGYPDWRSFLDVSVDPPEPGKGKTVQPLPVCPEV